MSAPELPDLDKTQMAYALGVSTQAIQKWDIKPKYKTGARVFYDLKEVIAYRLERDKQGKTTLTEERTKLVRAQALIAELNLKIKEGELIQSDVVENVWGSQISNFRAKLLTIPTKIAKLLSTINKPSEIEDIVRQNIYDALTELSEYKNEDYKPMSENTDENEPIPKATTKTKPVRVGGRKKGTK